MGGLHQSLYNAIIHRIQQRIAGFDSMYNLITMTWLYENLQRYRYKDFGATLPSERIAYCPSLFRQ